MADGGFSTARLERMRDVLAGHVGPGRMPGLVTLLERHGDVHVGGDLKVAWFKDPDGNILSIQSA